MRWWNLALGAALALGLLWSLGFVAWCGLGVYAALWLRAARRNEHLDSLRAFRWTAAGSYLGTAVQLLASGAHLYGLRRVLTDLQHLRAETGDWSAPVWAAPASGLASTLWLAGMPLLLGLAAATLASAEQPDGAETESTEDLPAAHSH